MKPQSIEMDKLLDNVYKLCHEFYGKKIAVRKELMQSLPSFVGDPALIQSALMNLCMNAKDAIESVRSNPNFVHRHEDQFFIHIISEIQTFEKNHAPTHPNKDQGRFIAVYITDNGIGIDPGNQAEVFEPFFTTKKTVGSGMGLVSAFGIVKQHTDGIEFESEYGKGA